MTISDLATYRKKKAATEHLEKLMKIRNDLISAAQLIASHAEKEREVLKIYNELGTATNNYTMMIDQYRKHLDRLERNQDGG